jgi:hypothetical protein
LACAALFLAGCPLGRAPIVLLGTPALELPPVIALLAAAAAVGLACSLRADLFATLFSGKTEWRSYTVLLGVYSVGTATLVASPAGLNVGLALAGGVAAGASCVPLAILIAQGLVRPTLRENMAAVAGVFGAAVGILWLVQASGMGAWGYGALAVLGVLGALGCLAGPSRPATALTPPPATPTKWSGFFALGTLALL